MNFQHDTSPLPDGRDIVIYPRGRTWGFRLPEQSTITTLEALNQIDLSTPSYGSAFQLERIEEVLGEVHVHLGLPGSVAHIVGSGEVMEPTRTYPFPEIQHELDRLKTELVSLGGSRQEADAWAQGASYDSHTARLRARIRELRGARV